MDRRRNFNLSPTVRPCSMTFREKLMMDNIGIIALNRTTTEMKKAIDPFPFVQELYKRKHIDAGAYCTFINKNEEGRSREEMCETLLSNLPCYCPIEEVISILHQTQYTTLAKQLYLNLTRTRAEHRVLQIGRVPVEDRKRIHSHFVQWKRLVHDASFKDPKAALRNLAHRFQRKLREPGMSELRHQQTADKYVALLGAEIDAHAITFNNDLSEHELFRELNNLTSESSNTLITQVVLLGRKANAYGIAGNFEAGENMLRGAQCYAEHLGPCLELANMYYIDVYFKLWKFERFPSDELRKDLLYAGDKGLWSLSFEEDEARFLWTRMFVLRMVFCLLGIGNRANIIPNCEVRTEHLLQAERLLANIDQDGIELRREMFYCVARARLHHLKNELLPARMYIKRAKGYAIKGNFKELEFIQQYTEELSRPFLNAMAASSHSQHINLLKQTPGTENVPLSTTREHAETLCDTEREGIINDVIYSGNQEMTILKQAQCMELEASLATYELAEMQSQNDPSGNGNLLASITCVDDLKFYRKFIPKQQNMTFLKCARTEECVALPADSQNADIFHPNDTLSASGKELFSQQQQVTFPKQAQNAEYNWSDDNVSENDPENGNLEGNMVCLERSSYVRNVHLPPDLCKNLAHTVFVTEETHDDSYSEVMRLNYCIGHDLYTAKENESISDESITMVKVPIDCGDNSLTEIKEVVQAQNGGNESQPEFKDHCDQESVRSETENKNVDSGTLQKNASERNRIGTLSNLSAEACCNSDCWCMYREGCEGAFHRSSPDGDSHPQQ